MTGKATAKKTEAQNYSAPLCLRVEVTSYAELRSPHGSNTTLMHLSSFFRKVL